MLIPLGECKVPIAHSTIKGIVSKNYEEATYLSILDKFKDIFRAFYTTTEEQNLEALWKKFNRSNTQDNSIERLITFINIRNLIEGEGNIKATFKVLENNGLMGTNFLSFEIDKVKILEVPITESQKFIISSYVDLNTGEIKPDATEKSVRELIELWKKFNQVNTTDNGIERFITFINICNLIKAKNIKAIFKILENNDLTGMNSLSFEIDDVKILEVPITESQRFIISECIDLNTREIKPDVTEQSIRELIKTRIDLDTLCKKFSQDNNIIECFITFINIWCLTEDENKKATFKILENNDLTAINSLSFEIDEVKILEAQITASQKFIISNYVDLNTGEIKPDVTEQSIRELINRDNILYNSIERFITFISIRNLIESKNIKVTFKVLEKNNGLMGTNSLSFEIDDVKILEVPITESQRFIISECVDPSTGEIKPDVTEQSIRELIEKRMSNSCRLSFETIAQINKNLPKDQRITLLELSTILRICYSIDDTILPKLFNKSSNNSRHSILIYRNKENGEYNILIKPNVKNDMFSHKNVKSGGTKDIKTSGILITLNSKKEFLAVKRVVTHSRRKHPDENDEEYKFLLKDDNLRISDHEDLLKDGFSYVNYLDNKGNSRHIYIKEYLGEALDEVKNELTMDNRIKIAKQLIQKFIKENPGDIKSKNITWDEENTHFIDSKIMVFTYTTKDGKRDGDYRMAPEEEIEKQRILGLTAVLYELFNPEQRVPKALYHDGKKTKDVLIEGEFSEYVIQAYNSSLSFEELQDAVDEL